jgi:hypothetical protein
MQGGADRAAVAEGKRRAVLDELTRHLHPAAPARVAERDLLAVRIAVDSCARVGPSAEARRRGRVAVTVTEASSVLRTNLRIR